MKTIWRLAALIFIAVHLIISSRAEHPVGAAELQARSLCEKGEKIVFSCELKRSLKIVSLCSSRELTKNRGYLQYRFGQPGKVELTYPERFDHSQQSFQYRHYFRYQFDLTEINFTLNGYNYSVFSDYNGEQKPVVSEQGVKVTPTNGKETTMVCRGSAKADFSDLADALPSEEQ